MSAGHAIALVGATGAAGTTTLRILEERNFPVRSLRAFASARSAGRPSWREHTPRDRGWSHPRRAKNYGPETSSRTATQGRTLRLACPDTPKRPKGVQEGDRG